MFDVIVKKFQRFDVIVNSFSKVDTFVGNIKYGTYKLYDKVMVLIRFSGTIRSKIKTEAFMSEIINPRASTRLNNKITSNASNIESMTSGGVSNKRKMTSIVSSKENMSSITKSKLMIISDPLVAYFRKLVEFDSLTLDELDNLTLEEMDFIMTLMSDSEKGRGGVDAYKYTEFEFSWI